jgi:hypothetical protein
MAAQLCPVCSEPQLISHGPGVLDCQYCHARIINGQLICPACKRANEIGLEHCTTCGEPLTVFGAVISRQSAGSGSNRLEQLKSQAGEIKAIAEEHSNLRMSHLNAADQRRIREEENAASEQKLRDQTILKYAAIGSGAFLLIVAVISLIIIL